MTPDDPIMIIGATADATDEEIAAIVEAVTEEQEAEKQ